MGGRRGHTPRRDTSRDDGGTLVDDGGDDTGGNDVVDDGTDAADATAGNDTGEPLTCLGTGEFDVELVSLDDPHGHFPFLKLFYAPDTPDNHQIERMGRPAINTAVIVARDSGTGEGHAGLGELTVDLDAECNIVESTQSIEFASDAFGPSTIDVTVSGRMLGGDVIDQTLVALILEGGDIPNGPIELEFGLAPR